MKRVLLHGSAALMRFRAPSIAMKSGQNFSETPETRNPGDGEVAASEKAETSKDSAARTVSLTLSLTSAIISPRGGAAW